jgi:mRNA interferase HicA
MPGQRLDLGRRGIEALTMGPNPRRHRPGKGSHLKVFLNGKQSTPPMHGSAELGKGLEAAIRRQLGLKYATPCSTTR